MFASCRFGAHHTAPLSTTHLFAVVADPPLWAMATVDVPYLLRFGDLIGDLGDALFFF